MHIIDIIALVVLGISFMGIVVIVVRKFPVLKTVDLDRVAKEHHARVKSNLTEERLRRKMTEAQQRVGGRLRPLFGGVGKALHALYDKLVELERTYREKADAGKNGNASLVSHKNTVIDLLGKASEHIEEHNFVEAEKKYIEVIALDPRNFEAYKGLGEVYLQQQDYTHARAALSHALKIKPDEAEVNADVAQAFKELGRINLAQKSIEKALEIEEKNPKYLDIQIALALEAGDKQLAEKALQKLRAVNPENQKINEYEERILQIKIKRNA